MGTSAGIPVRESALALASCVALSLALYAPFLPCFFLWDDIPLFVMASKGMGVSALQCLGPTPNGFWRPLNFLLCHGIEAVFGKWPPAFHATSAAIHGTVGWLVWRCARELLGAGPRWSAVAAVLFIVHPAGFECCLHFANTCDSMIALLSLAAWLAFERAAARNARAWLAAGACAVLLSFGAKESAVALPFALAVLAVARRGIGRREIAVQGTLGSIGILLALAILAGMARNDGSYLAAGRFSVDPRTSFRCLGDYATSIAVPYLHLLEWPWRHIRFADPIHWVARCLALATIVALAVASLARKWLRPAAALLLAAMIMVLPSCAVAGPPHSRYIYPALPWAVLAATELLRLLHARMPRLAVACCAGWLAMLLPGVRFSPTTVAHRETALRIERLVESARSESASWPADTAVRIVDHPHPGPDDVRWPYCQLIFFVWLERRDIVVVLDDSTPADRAYRFDGVRLVPRDSADLPAGAPPTAR